MLTDHFAETKDHDGHALWETFSYVLKKEHGEGALSDQWTEEVCRQYADTIFAIAQATSVEEAFYFVRSRCRSIHKRLPTNKFARALVEKIVTERLAQSGSRQSPDDFETKDGSILD